MVFLLVTGDTCGKFQQRVYLISVRFICLILLTTPASWVNRRKK